MKRAEKRGAQSPPRDPHMCRLCAEGAGVSVNAGSGGEEMEEICLAPLGRDCRPCWASLSLGTAVGFCATCWDRTFESGVLSTSERRMLCGEHFG
ncbi:hypothetical protein QQF64_011492 [Cirrhinus molitorella]|uniref:Uncharacterized protein n=2 Tax=Cirrhinus molitorella TaxID=172907 RepID=A0AA88PE61_9TELE|nr:hypothetical protein Q8A67_019256 [Cirrhinus molitorella]